MIELVVSGGQSGVDQLALKVARRMKIPTGGTAPKGWRTENGSRPQLAEFGLVESWSPNYDVRTEQNVLNSDFTVIFGDITSAGSKLTIRLCEKHSKPYLCNPRFLELSDRLKELDCRILNVAGNRGSKLTMEKRKAIAWELTLTLDCCNNII